jgi:hypothetical protein
MPGAFGEIEPADVMRSGSGHRPGGRHQGSRPIPQQQRPPERNQILESHGPDVRIRGSAHQIFERYVALTREAATGGDRVGAENFYQHAEHYFRLANASRDANPQLAPWPTTPADVQMDGHPAETDRDDPQPGWGDDRPGFV